MNELLKKIYDTVICYEREAIQMEKNIDIEINELIQPYQEQLTQKEKEELKNLLYGVAFTAEREGFMMGMKYMLKMVIALQSE